MILHLDFSRWLLFLFVASNFKETKTCEDGDIRLAGGPNDFEGRLESCSGSTWGHVCGTGGWGRTEGEVVCRHLGYLSGTSPLVQSVAATRLRYGAQEGPAFVNQVQCAGSELAFDNCSKEVINEMGCSTLGGFVYIVCQDPECEGSAPDSVRLVGGLSDSDGRVEVCDNDGRRRQVCQDGWDDQDATVVCRTLGFLDGLDAVSVTGLLISVTLPAYSSVNCSGSEEYFTHCVPSTSIKVTFPTNQCNGFAGVICSDPQPNTPTPSLFPSSTIGTTSSISRPLLGSSTKTQPTGSPNSLRPVPTVQPTGPPNTLRPVPTVQPTPGATDNMLLIIVVGVVGGAIVLLLLLVLILFILILLRRNHSSDSMTTANGGAMNNGNEHLEHPPIPLEDLENSIKEEFQPLPPRHRTSSEYNHVLLNPLHGNKMRSRSNTIISDQSSVFEDPGYADIKGAVRKRSSLERTLNDKLNPYSTPSDTISQKSHSPRQVHSNTASNRDLSLQPYVDEQGYAALESQSHIYDEMNVYDVQTDRSNRPSKHRPGNEEKHGARNNT
ncbi:scavenger receptor cysteine-rich domain superfamily protein-like isoform X2 [Halichondria panicea]|uniref:scavenger receptor cysteine-rich domain superfamily protein-like isoform X2 n=1 Tax=Halichondria panicea TaxID=6063 RepID=UPI00312B4898